MTMAAMDPLMMRQTAAAQRNILNLVIAPWVVAGLAGSQVLSSETGERGKGAVEMVVVGGGGGWGGWSVTSMRNNISMHLHVSFTELLSSLKTGRPLTPFPL
jgi:hypothetical protein